MGRTARAYTAVTASALAVGTAVLISMILFSRLAERELGDESGFVCTSDRSDVEPHRLLCHWGLAIVSRRSFQVSEHRPVRETLRLGGNSSSFS